jgi:anaerobic C4-dicarboxylate transporter
MRFIKSDSLLLEYVIRWGFKSCSSVAVINIILMFILTMGDASVALCWYWEASFAMINVFRCQGMDVSIHLVGLHWFELRNPVADCHVAGWMW